MIDVEMARALADRVHYRQLDKAGRPYIEHCERVASYLKGDYDKALALLHDTVEDDYYSDDLEWDIKAIGGERMYEDVIMLTRMEGETYEQYIQRIAEKGSVSAVYVKLMDLMDNADERRLALLHKEDQDRLRKKYAKAHDVLAARIKSDIYAMTSAIF